MINTKNYKLYKAQGEDPRSAKDRKSEQVLSGIYFCRFLNDDGICTVNNEHCEPDSLHCRRYD